MYTPKQIVERAKAAKDNVPDTCQKWVREIMGAPSVGDVDRDGAADAEDGWKSEPENKRHEGDRNPPAGMAVSYLGGSNDHGHRAISLGKIDGRTMIRSTDANGRGHVGTVPLDWPEKEWGLRYAGWSETISGHEVPRDEKLDPAKPVQTVKVPQAATPVNVEPTRNTKVDRSKRLLTRALENAVEKGNEQRADNLRAALKKLDKV